jgi:A/G-specific adenine glycosylase
MELGARLCVAGQPRCPVCPVSRFCRAHAEGRAASLPARTPRRAKKVVELTCVAVQRRGRVLLVRRPPGVLLGGTWVLPASELGPGEPETAAVTRALADTGLVVRDPLRPAGTVRHIFTHRDVTARVVWAPVSGSLRRGSGARWISIATPGLLALSSFTRKTLALLNGQSGRPGVKPTTASSSGRLVRARPA